MSLSEFTIFYHTNAFEEIDNHQSVPRHDINAHRMYLTPSPSASSLSGPFSPNQSEEEMMSMQVQPHLRIVEQPVSKFRFRYKSEMQGAHGSLLGRRETSKKRSYPTVELVNYDGEARIRCLLYTATAPLIPHMHQLIGKQSSKEILDHEIVVSERNGHKAEFKGLGIVHVSKKDLKYELVRKKENMLIEKIRGDETLAHVNEETIRKALQEKMPEFEKEAAKECENMDPNKVRLCFQAFIRGPMGEVEYICPDVFSETIQNMKSAETGDLRICRMDKYAGCCNGGNEVYILVEKVCKKNIQVRFFEVDENEQEVWSDFGQFNEFDVHHQYAIVFRTPRYRRTDISENVKVKVELVRPKDKARSEPLTFTYKPVRKNERRESESTFSYSSDSFSSSEAARRIPRPLKTLTDDPMVCGSETSSVNSMNLPSDTIRQVLDEIAAGTDDTDTIHQFEMFLNSRDFTEYSQSFQEDQVKNPNMDVLHPYSEISNQMELDHEMAIPDHYVPLNNMSADIADIILTDSCGKESKVSIEPIKKREIHGLEQEKKKDDSSSLAKKACTKLLKLMKSRHPSRLQDMKHIIRAEDQEYGPLHAAVMNGQLKELSDLLSLIIKSNLLKLINSTNRRKRTPLMTAVEENNLDCLKLLCMAKADLNCTDYKDNSALHLAAKCRHTKCLEVLLSFKRTKDSLGKIELDRKNDKGQTALHIAVMQKDLGSVKLLATAGADLNTKTGTAGQTPLHLAVEFDSTDIVRFLLSQDKINPREKNFNEKTAQDIICPNQKEIISLFEKAANNEKEKVEDVGDYEEKVKKEDEEEEDDYDDEDVNDGGDYDDDDCSDDDDDDEDDDEGEEQEKGLDQIDQEEEIVGKSAHEGEMEKNNISNDLSLLDESTLNIIVEDLNIENKWKTVCQKLNCGFLIDVCGSNQNQNPSHCLLNYLEFDKKVTITELRNVLVEINSAISVNALNKLLTKMQMKKR